MVLSGLEKSINAYLSLDPDTLARCKALKDKVIKVTLTDVSFSFFILPNEQGLNLITNYFDKPDAEIRGSALGLFKTGLAKGDSKAAFNNQIEISGDSHLIQAFRDILSDIDIDWEEHLSTITGDIFAHQIGSTVKKAKTSFLRSIGLLQKNMTEYLQVESEALPTKESIEQFISDVTTLREDVERAEARLAHLNRLYTKDSSAL